MKKIIIILFSLLLLCGCQTMSERKGFILSEYGEHARIKYVNDNYYVTGNNSIDVLKDNIFEKFIENNENQPYLFVDTNSVYVGLFGSNDKMELGKLNIIDENNLKYQCKNSLNSKDYSEFSVIYNNEECLKFNVINIYPYTNYSSILLFENNEMYLLQLKYNPNGVPHIDESINGLDYVGSELFKLDIENKKATSIFSTDNTTAIAYGNEKTIYYADEKYDIYRLDLNTNNSKLVYDTQNKDTVYVEYCHNKLFIFDSDDYIKVIDVE